MATVAEELIALNTRVAQLLAGVQISKNLMDSVAPNALQVAEDAATVATFKVVVKDIEQTVKAAELATLGAKDAAIAAKDASLINAEASGSTKIFDTLPQAVAALASIDNDEVVRVLVDGANQNRQSFYRKQGGILVYKTSTITTNELTGLALYSSEPEGRVASTDGQLFRVSVGPGTQVWKRNNIVNSTFIGWLGEVIFDNVSALLASTFTNFAIGQIIRTRSEGFAYIVAPSEASEHHVTTGGGVKLYAQPINGMLTPRQFGASGSGNDRPALVAWLTTLTATGLTGFVDRDYSFATSIMHSGAVRIRGPFSDTARLIYTGTGDGFEFTGAVDLDGLVIDGNLATSAVPTSTSEVGCLFGIHGPMDVSPGYLSGVRLGRIRVQNTRRRAALALVNLSDLVVERIVGSRTYGNAFHIVGLLNARINSYNFDRVGNLAPESSRLGAGISLYAEGDSSKTPATWYVVAGVQPTDNVQFGLGQGSRTTDTSIYLHNTYGSGVKNVRFGHYQGTLLGKDGVKFRGGASGCRMSSAQLTKVGLRFAVIEDAGSDNNEILNIQGEQAGYDVIGEWLDGSPGTRNFTSAANGLNQTLNQTPGGLRIVDVSNCRMTGSVKGVRDAPHNAAEGNALNFRNCLNSIVEIVAEDTDGAIRFSGLTKCTLRAEATNMARNGANVTAAAFCDDAGSESSENYVKVLSRETSGASVLQHPLRINGTGTGWDVEVDFIGPHSLPSSIVTRSDSAVFSKYQGASAQVEYFRQSLTFDASGLAVVTHNYGFLPSVQAMHEGGSFYEVDVSAVNAIAVTFRLRQSDDATPDASSTLVPNVSRTIHYQLAKYRQSGGFPY